MLKISEMSKDQIRKDFGITNSEILEIEIFMNDNNDKTAKDIILELLKTKKLNCNQKVIISYVIGNSARENALREKEEHNIDEYKGKIIGVDLPNIPLSAG